MLDSVRTKEIFTHILDLMKHPGLHEDTVLSLLYMIKTFLHFVRIEGAAQHLVPAIHLHID
jgi:hypothetical protein